MANNIFDMEHGSVVDNNLQSQLLQRFIAAETTDIVIERIKLNIARSNSFLDLAGKIKGLLKNGRIAAPFLGPTHLVIQGHISDQPHISDHPTLIFFSVSGAPGSRYDESEEEDEEGAMAITVDIYALPSAAIALRDKVLGILTDEKMAKVRWWYKSDSRLSSQDIYLPKPSTQLRAEYYPDMGDPYKFMDAYLKSPAAVLLMAGPPGTGKTTLLRHMIVERNLLAHVIYDETLMESDSIFQNFLFDKNSDIMVIEDADTILAPRDRETNKLMARFLSVSDGLIKLPNKKIVFTTNLTDFRNVDDALMRPGRCHAVVHTRPLNLTEAQAAAKVTDVPVPIEKGEYTLAELFNQGYRAQARQVGFGARH